MAALRNPVLSPLGSLSSSAAVAGLVGALYGEGFASAPPPSGVLHVAAALRPPQGGALRNLLINETTPLNPYDAFALVSARARADAIIVTGKILRAEPGLSYEADAAMVGETAAAGLASWRRQMGHDSPPLVLVLSSGKNLPMAHPVFRREGRCAVFCPEEAAAALQADSERPSSLEVHGHASPSIRAAVQHLRDAGCRSILVEAGPSTSRELYSPSPQQVTELLLTTLQGSSVELDPRCCGDTFVPEEDIARVVAPAAAASSPLPAKDGPTWQGEWHFQRFTSPSPA